MGLNSDFINNLVDELLEDIQGENKDMQDNHELPMGRAVTEQEFEDFMKQHEWDADDYSEQIQAEDVYLQAKLNGTEITDEVSYYQHTSGNKRNEIVDGTLDLNN